MARLCARPSCSAPAAATFNFDGLNRIVWLNDLADPAVCSAGDLCARHAERLQPPRNWELRDARPTRVTCPAAAAPSRHLPPARPLAGATHTRRSAPPVCRAVPASPSPACRPAPPPRCSPGRSAASTGLDGPTSPPPENPAHARLAGRAPSRGRTARRRRRLRRTILAFATVDLLILVGVLLLVGVFTSASSPSTAPVQLPSFVTGAARRSLAPVFDRAAIRIPRAGDAGHGARVARVAMGGEPRCRRPAPSGSGSCCPRRRPMSRGTSSTIRTSTRTARATTSGSRRAYLRQLIDELGGNERLGVGAYLQGSTSVHAQGLTPETEGLRPGHRHVAHRLRPCPAQPPDGLAVRRVPGVRSPPGRHAHGRDRAVSGVPSGGRCWRGPRAWSSTSSRRRKRTAGWSPSSSGVS